MNAVSSAVPKHPAGRPTAPVCSLFYLSYRDYKVISVITIVVMELFTCRQPFGRFTPHYIPADRV